MTWPAAPTRTTWRKRPERTTARLDMPLPIRSMTYVPARAHIGSSSRRRTRRIGGSA